MLDGRFMYRGMVVGIRSRARRCTRGALGKEVISFVLVKHEVSEVSATYLFRLVKRRERPVQGPWAVASKRMKNDASYNQYMGQTWNGHVPLVIT